MATLKVNRQEAAHVLSAHGDEGNTLLASATELPNEPAFQGWRNKRTRWIKRTEEAINTLMSLSERLQYADEPAPPPTVTQAVVAQPEKGEPVIFLVHGHDPIHATKSGLF